VARYAGYWNAVAPSPEAFRELSAYLDGLLKENGRQPGEVTRSVMTTVIYGRDRETLGKVLETPPFNNPRVEGKSIEEKFAFWRDERHALIGNSEEIAAQIAAFSAAGAQEVMTQWWHLDDIAGLRRYAEDVLPGLR
jgi:alkanesulfonate monooxygenase SsuD/methylene tetrahydromethanopterin reductase-like flavin-dependent oxidoreductase (luciferase family)